MAKKENRIYPPQRISRAVKVDCGCSLVTNHGGGDRAMQCKHGKTWTIRAVVNNQVTYLYKEFRKKGAEWKEVE
jgi:hypothetical protein